MLWNINIELLQFLNNLWNNYIVNLFVKIFADGPILLLPIFFLAMWMYAVKKQDIVLKEKLMIIFYWCIIGIILSLTIQQFIHEARPEQNLSATGKLLLKHLPTAAFPSDHATVGMAFVVGLYLFWLSFWGNIFLPLIALMCLARVIAWVHWPFDIVWGMIVGSVAASAGKYFLASNKVVKKVNSFIMHLLQIIKL